MPEKNTQSQIDVSKLKRVKPEKGEDRHNGKEPGVSSGPVGEVLSYVFNPTREKIREVTRIDPIQGKLLPQLDLNHLMWQYLIEVALYRQNPKEYAELFGREKPETPDLIGEFTYRTAQWQKSIGGKNMDAGIDIALAEMEGKAGEEEEKYNDKGLFGDQ